MKNLIKMPKIATFFRFFTFIAVIILSLTVCSNPAGDNGDNGDTPPPPPAPYIITGSGTSFTATRDGTAIPDASGVTIPNLMTAIRAHAAGEDITIQFGSGGDDVLDIRVPMDFNNTGGDWGSTVTLTGSITGSITDDYTIQVQGIPLSIISTANIAKTNGTNGAINYQGTGTLTINSGTVSRMYSAGSQLLATINIGGNSRLIMTGGTVQSTSETAIISFSNHPEAISISGGTVQATTGTAIRTSGANASGIIRISDTAVIRSQNIANNSGTICLDDSAAATTHRLIMTGGQVINDADAQTNANASAIRNRSVNGTMQLPADFAGITGRVFQGSEQLFPE